MSEEQDFRLCRRCGIVPVDKERRCDECGAKTEALDDENLEAYGFD